MTRCLDCPNSVKKKSKVLHSSWAKEDAAERANKISDQYIPCLMALDLCQEII